MNKKIVFLDIDGTFTEPGENTAPESAVMAVKQARANGHYVYLCTGRNYDMLKPLLQYGFDGYIGSAGGYIVCNDEVIFDCPMEREQQNRVLKILKENGIFRTLECRNGTYADDGFKEFIEKNASGGNNSEFIRWREQLEKTLNIRPFSEYENSPIYKIVIMAGDSSALEEPSRLLEDEFLFSIQDKNAAGIVNGELINRKFDKGQAVVRVCQKMGMDIKDSIGFGDSANDMEMLQVTGTSVCMKNGSQELKQFANYICPAVSEDGIQQAFRKFGLIE